MGSGWQASWAIVKILRIVAQVETEKSVFLKLFKNDLSNLAEIFTTYQTQVCVDFLQKLWPLLNWPASHGPFRQNF